MAKEDLQSLVKRYENSKYLRITDDMDESQRFVAETLRSVLEDAKRTLAKDAAKEEISVDVG